MIHLPTHPVEIIHQFLGIHIFLRSQKRGSYHFAIRSPSPSAKRSWRYLDSILLLNKKQGNPKANLDHIYQVHLQSLTASFSPLKNDAWFRRSGFLLVWFRYLFRGEVVKLREGIISIPYPYQSDSTEKVSLNLNFLKPLKSFNGWMFFWKNQPLGKPENSELGGSIIFRCWKAVTLCAGVNFRSGSWASSGYCCKAQISVSLSICRQRGSITGKDQIFPVFLRDPHEYPLDSNGNLKFGKKSWTCWTPVKMTDLSMPKKALTS